MNKQTMKTVKVSATGVQFGNAWFSHEQITVYTADQLNAGTCGVTGGAYMAWLSSEEPAQAYDEAKERDLFASWWTETEILSENKLTLAEKAWLARAKSRAGIQS